MNNITGRIERFLFEQTIWMFLTIIMLVGILLVVESNAQTWSIYLSFTGFFSLLYSPILVFSFYRKKLQKKLSLSALRLAWATSFIVYPAVVMASSRLPFMVDALSLFSDHIQMSNLEDGTFAILASITFAIILVELAIQSDQFISQKILTTDWLKNIGLEKTIIVLMLLFSFFIMSTDYVERYDFPQNTSELLSAIPVFISHTFQFFLINLIYYSFYWINHYILINKVLKQKGAIYYGFGLMGTVLLLYPVAAQLIAWIPMVQKLGIHPVVNGSIFEGIHALIPLVGMILSIPFILTVQWFKQRSELAALDKEKSETELNLLKQQINPHFFFNTLNNLYALSIKKDEATPDVILMLSELMRYVIYRGKEKEVKIEEEIKYIRDYVSLQQIRLHKQLDFQFQEEVEDGRLPIPPLLFIILVENAFKHGIEPAENEAILHLYLKSRKNQLTFCCINSFEGRSSDKVGIGLANLRRRLDLLFPDQHQLIIEQNDFTFKATLDITTP